MVATKQLDAWFKLEARPDKQEKEAQACVDLSCDALQGLWYAGWVGAEDLPDLVDGREQRERLDWLHDPARRGTAH